jgi:hypothetical protein
LPGQPPIAVALFLLVPIFLLVALYRANAAFHAFANRIPLPFIVGAHLWRFVGAAFVIAVPLGLLPAGFGIPEGVGDVIAAAFALPLALALHRRRPVRGYFVAWNVFGLLDLVSAITMGILYSDGSFGILRSGVSTALMIAFPINLIPTFLVPMFILFHLLALARRDEVASVPRSSRTHLEEAAA